MDSKTEKLERLETRMEEDKNLPLQESNLVFGEGPSSAEVLFIGEAPGFHENEQRRPFVGRAGQLLTKTLEEMGWRREDVYITNIVKRRPPDNRDPLPEEIEQYQPYLKEQIEIMDPKIIVPLGRFSMNHFLPQAKISRDQGKIFRMASRLVMPVYHPAAALRSTGVMNEFKSSIRKLPAILKKYDALIKKEPQTPAPEEKQQEQNSLF